MKGAASYSVGHLLNEVLRSRGLTQARLASTMNRPAQMVSEIVTGKKSITSATALGLERALGIPAEVWLTTQAICELRREQANS